MCEGNVSETKNEIKDAIIATFSQRKTTYSKILIQYALSFEDGKWKNIFTKISLLQQMTTIAEKRHDYDKLKLGVFTTTMSNFAPLIEKLVDESKLIINGCPEVLISGSFDDPIFFDSSEYLGTGWPTRVYKFCLNQKSAGQMPNDILLSLDLPLYSSAHAAIRDLMEVDLNRYKGLQGTIMILLPYYHAKIEKLKIGSKALTINILSKNVELKKLLGKLYCEKNTKVFQQDIIFDKHETIIPIGFSPDIIDFYLLSKETGEQLDFRRYNIRWPSFSLSQDIIIDIPLENIRQLIKNGENDKVEFKREIGDDKSEFVETVVSFANGQGGTILLGIDDRANIVGINDSNLEDRIMKILRHNCEPPILPKMKLYLINEKKILIIQVNEGENKPYTVRDKGVYVRAGSTDRIATRYELDDFYRDSNNNFNYTW